VVSTRDTAPVADEPVAEEPRAVEAREAEPVVAEPVVAEPPSPPAAESAVEMPPPPPDAEPESAVEAPPAAPGEPLEASASEDAEQLRRRWAEVLGTLERRRVTWVLVSQSAQVARVEDGQVHLAFSSPQLAERFNGGQHAENVSLAIRETLGLQVRVVGDGAGTDSRRPATTSATPPAPQEPRTTAPPTPAPTAASRDPQREPSDAASPSSPGTAATEDEASDSDDAAPGTSLTGPEVIATMLGGTVVEDE
jgi:DNA polymerase-3 subunit gamma/tau